MPPIQRTVTVATFSRDEKNAILVIFWNIPLLNILNFYAILKKNTRRQARGRAGEMACRDMGWARPMRTQANYPHKRSKWFREMFFLGFKWFLVISDKASTFAHTRLKRSFFSESHTIHNGNYGQAHVLPWHGRLCKELYAQVISLQIYLKQHMETYIGSTVNDGLQWP
jgi:hypothetical protein